MARRNREEPIAEVEEQRVGPDHQPADPRWSKPGKGCFDAAVRSQPRMTSSRPSASAAA